MQCQTCKVKYAVTAQWTGECVRLDTHCLQAHFSAGSRPNTPGAMGMALVALDERMPLHIEHQPTDLCLQANVYDESHLAPHPRLKKIKSE